MDNKSSKSFLYDYPNIWGWFFATIISTLVILCFFYLFSFNIKEINNAAENGVKTSHQTKLEGVFLGNNNIDNQKEIVNKEPNSLSKNEELQEKSISKQEIIKEVKTEVSSPKPEISSLQEKKNNKPKPVEKSKNKPQKNTNQNAPKNIKSNSVGSDKTSKVTESKKDSSSLGANNSSEKSIINSATNSSSNGQVASKNISQKEMVISCSGEKVFLDEQAAQDYKKSMSIVKSWVKAHVKYPKRAIKMGLEGVVMLKICVNSNGKLVSGYILQSSCKSILDNASKELLEKILGSETGIHNSSYEVIVPVRYELRGLL